jgi:hypothetical protein
VSFFNLNLCDLIPVCGPSGAVFFNFTRLGVAPGFLQCGSVVMMSYKRRGTTTDLSWCKMPCFKLGIGFVTKNRDELLNRHFDISEPDTVTDTQGDFHDPYPDIIPVQKCAVI